MQLLKFVVSLRATNGNRETWWWGDKVDEGIKTKHACFRAYKALVKDGRLSEANEAKAAHNEAKRLAKRAVWQAKLDAEKG